VSKKRGSVVTTIVYGSLGMIKCGGQNGEVRKGGDYACRSFLFRDGLITGMSRVSYKRYLLIRKVRGYVFGKIGG